MAHARLATGLDIYVSPKFTTAHWKELNLSNACSEDWGRAVEIFLDRLEGRFIRPIQAIRRHLERQIAEFSGFAIVAIDCLVIETLIQFRRGEPETSGSHADAFGEFFLQSRHFQNSFDTMQKAHIFYGHFRCGILHQAQTKRLSRIRYGVGTMVQPAIPGNLEEGLILDRELFHKALLREINDYADCLRTPKRGEDKLLRRNFARKMNYIVDGASAGNTVHLKPTLI